EIDDAGHDGHLPLLLPPRPLRWGQAAADLGIVPCWQRVDKRPFRTRPNGRFWPLSQPPSPWGKGSYWVREDHLRHTDCQGEQNMIYLVRTLDVAPGWLACRLTC